MPVYAHWFPVELQKVIDSANRQLSESENQMLNFKILEESFTINRQHILNTSSAIKTACQLEKIYTEACSGDITLPISSGMLASKSVSSCELAFSSLMTLHLDRFMFSNDNASVGFCLHQGPTRVRTSNPEVSDLYVCENVDGTCGNIVALGDLKRHDLDHAIRETGLYCTTAGMIQISDPSLSPVIMGIAGTRSELSLLVCIRCLPEQSIPISEGCSMWLMEVCRLDPYDQALLCAIYCGIHYLIKTRLRYRVPLETPVPIHSKKLIPFKGEKSRVFLCEEDQTVYKFYVHGSVEKPNYELLEELSVYKDAKREKVSSSLKLLEYDFIQGDHEPSKIREFLGVAKMLDNLHSRKFVHGDVRLANIVFTGDTSHLIDFDLASEEGSCYPFLYRGDLEERHEEAYVRAIMKKEHDVYSLVFLIRQFVEKKEVTDCSEIFKTPLCLSKIIDTLEKE